MRDALVQLKLCWQYKHFSKEMKQAELWAGKIGKWVINISILQ